MTSDKEHTCRPKRPPQKKSRFFFCFAKSCIGASHHATNTKQIITERFYIINTENLSTLDIHKIWFTPYLRNTSICDINKATLGVARRFPQRVIHSPGFFWKLLALRALISAGTTSVPDTASQRTASGPAQRWRSASSVPRRDRTRERGGQGGHSLTTRFRLCLGPQGPHPGYMK